MEKQIITTLRPEELESLIFIAVIRALKIQKLSVAPIEKKTSTAKVKAKPKKEAADV